MISADKIKSWLEDQVQTNDSGYEPFLIGNDPDLSDSDLRKAAEVSGSKDILMVGTGGLYSLLLLLRIWQAKNHEGHVKLVILDTSQRVFDQVWKPFQEGVSKLQSPIDSGGLLESITSKISRGVLTQYDLGKNYVDQDVDMFVDELFKALPGEKPQHKLVTLKEIVQDVDFARVSWGAKDLFKDLTPGEDQLILYPSNIEPFLVNEERFNFKANISMPGSIVISSDLVNGRPNKMSLSLNTEQKTPAPVTVEQAEAFIFSVGAKPIRANTIYERMTDSKLTESVSCSKVDDQEKLPLAATISVGEAEAFIFSVGAKPIHANTIDERMTDSKLTEAVSCSKVDEAIFVERFREHYKPGFLGGHWGRLFARPIMNESTIRAYARRRPGSATAKAVVKVDKKLNVS